jgi:hypothetical protein
MAFSHPQTKRAVQQAQTLGASIFDKATNWLTVANRHLWGYQEIGYPPP